MLSLSIARVPFCLLEADVFLPADFAVLAFETAVFVPLFPVVDFLFGVVFWLPEEGGFGVPLFPFAEDAMFIPLSQEVS